MSDFSSDFGAFYVSIIAIVSMLACAILLYNRTVSTVPAATVKEVR
jgi:hypothetical protein